MQFAHRRNFCDHPRRHQNMFYTDVVATKTTKKYEYGKAVTTTRGHVVAGVWLLKLPVHKALKNELGEFKIKYVCDFFFAFSLFIFKG